MQAGAVLTFSGMPLRIVYRVSRFSARLSRQKTDGQRIFYKITQSSSFRSPSPHV